MSVIITRRSNCRLCSSQSIELVVKLKPIPLSENYTIDQYSGKNSQRFPVDVYMCEACGHVQQLDVIDSKSLWENYTYFSSEAKGMKEHLEGVAAEILEEYPPPKGSLVVDIGSNDGSLLRPFKDAGLRVLGVDPAREIARSATESGIETLPEVISIDLASRIKHDYGSAAIICMFNAFAHADDMDEVAYSIRSLLSSDGIFVFEAQYLADIIEHTLIATIFHEHISHHSIKPLIKFFEKHGMEMFDVHRVAIQHGSIIGYVQLKGGRNRIRHSVGRLIEFEDTKGLDKIESIREFSRNVENLRTSAEYLVRQWKSAGAKVAGYGAARSGPTLIAQLGLGEVIEYIVDDHPQKVGRYSSGDGIPILATAELLSRMPDYVVILAWVHVEKIMASNQDYLDRGGKFVVLCPQTRIVSKKGNHNIHIFQKTG